jgi:hypothetical protein
LWLHVVIEDGDQSVIFESGAYTPDGKIVGCDADDSEDSFEPHYEMISNPNQVQIYESIMHNTDGDVTYTLLHAAGYVKDNRLLPIGFDSQNSPDAIAVQGLAAEDPDYQDGADYITYTVSANNTEGPYRARVELLFQSFSYQTIEDIYKIDTPEVTQFKSVFAESDRSPIIIASVESTTVE